VKYAAIVTRSFIVPGDERSRTHPGHGYPAHTETAIELVDFHDKTEMEAWVLRQNASYSKPTFKLIQYEELKYETTVSVKVTP